MALKYVTGDLIQLAKNGEFDAIAHGCNCWNNMGSGIALQIKENFPLAWHMDRDTIKGYAQKLGGMSIATIYWDDGIKFDVLNLYTQFNYGIHKTNLDYDALERCFILVNKRYNNKKIGIPKIGAGLAKGDWSKIAPIIENICSDCDITVVEYEGDTYKKIRY